MSQPLETLDPDTIAPPKSRIGTPSDCCGYVQRLIQQDTIRATHRVKIKGMIDGNAPWSKTDLRAKGQASNTNLNFRQGESIINQYKTPYYDLLAEVPLLADIKTNFGTVTEKGDWSQIISEEFDRMVKKWRRWDYVVQFHQFQMLVFGIGPVYYHDAVDWRPDCAKYSDVLVEDGSASEVTEIEGICILKDYIPTKLYAYIHDKAAAEARGWDVSEVEWGIIQSKFPGSTPNDQRAIEWYQQKFKNADMFNGEGAAVRTGHVLVSEFSDTDRGRVSHHIVRSDQSRTKFMFKDDDAFQSMEEVMVPFFYDIGDGTWHSIRGLGYAIYPYVEVFNRLRCKEVDGAMIAASVMLKSTDSNAVQKNQLLKIQNLGILPPGIDIATMNIGQGLDATVTVRRDMEMGLNQNIGLLQRAPGQPNPRKGQKQAILEMQQAAQLGKGNINRYYSSLDWLFETMFRRAAKSTASQPGGKEAKEFINRCVQRGVPMQALKDIDTVKAYRSVGAGSAVNALMVTETLVEYMDRVPNDDGKDEIMRAFISRLAGNDMMYRVMGPKQPDRTKQDDWEAQQENNDLREGGKCMVADGQSNVLHLESHLGDMEQHVQEVDQDAQQNGGMDSDMLHQLSIHLDAGGIHAHEHLDAIKRDESRAAQYKELYKRFELLSRVQDKVKNNLKEMQKAMAAQQPQQPDTDALKAIPYKDAPESVKLQLEEKAKVQRQPGDISVAGQKMIDTNIKTTLKAQQVKQRGTIDDIKLSREVNGTNGRA